MTGIRKVSLILTAVIWLPGLTLAAGASADPRTGAQTPPPRTSGVIVSMQPKTASSAARPVAGNSTAPDAAETGQDVAKTRSPGAGFHVRVRLDDGSYQGFHQSSSEELRVGDRVQVEIDRLRRAPSGQIGK